ncbi:MAG TPA: AAA family ATPase [Thermoanaerobaculia bacterium]|nr:AAA family ATPase [Thermoanaerobaculia bacterium]
MTTTELPAGQPGFAAPPFVGRTGELARMQKALDDALAGTPRVLLIAGEAGAGKSTLLNELLHRAEAATPPFVTAIGECSAATGASDAYLPFREILKILTGDAETPKKNEKLLAATAKVLADTAPDLISIFIPGSKLLTEVCVKFAREAGWIGKEAEKPAAIPKELDQEKIFRQYAEVLQSVAKEHPLLLALDDLQWADASSISLLFHLARQVKQARLLIVGTYRPNDVAIGRAGERHPLEQVTFELKRYFGDVVIDLGHDDTGARRSFVDSLLDAEPNRLDDQFRTALLGHTEGHPLFTVELLRNLRERGCLRLDDGQWVVDDRLSWSDLPPRIEGVIAERVGRLEQELREILTIASVGVGAGDFLAQIVAKIQNIEERRLLKILSADLDKRHGLVLESSVHRRGRRVLAHYRFTHALVQKYLYSDLSDAEKMLLHGDVAAMLEEMYEGGTDEIATDLAYHYDQAGDAENALRYYEKVLEQSLRCSAYREALVHANRALELVAELPPSPERDLREFTLILRWAAPTRALRGWASADLKPRYDRARDLIAGLGDRLESTQFLFTIWSYYLVRCELAESLQTATQCLEVAQGIGCDEGVLAAHTSIANSAFWSGELEICLKHTAAAMEAYPKVDQHGHLLQYGMDTQVIANQFAAWIACVEGRFDDARRVWEEFIPKAEALKHPFSHAIALNTGAWMYQLCGDVAAARKTSEKLLALATTHGFPSYEGLGTMVRGWALSFEDSAAGIAGIESGFEKWRVTAGPLITTYYAILYADALQRADRREEASSVIYRAIDFGEEHGEEIFLPRLEAMRRELTR